MKLGPPAILLEGENEIDGLHDELAAVMEILVDAKINPREAYPLLFTLFVEIDQLLLIEVEDDE